MNKKEFILNLEKYGDFKNEVASGVYKVFVEALKSSLLSVDDKLHLPEIGKFEVKKRKQRNGVNPKTGESIVIPEKITIKFTPSKEILDSLNK